MKNNFLTINRHWSPSSLALQLLTVSPQPPPQASASICFPPTVGGAGLGSGAIRHVESSGLEEVRTDGLTGMGLEEVRLDRVEGRRGLVMMGPE